MTAKDITSGVGVRHSELFVLNTQTGLPNCAFNSGTLIAGTVVEGIKTFNYNNPQPQRFTHYGDDRPFAQDSLPPTTIGDFTLTTAKTNLALDAFTEGTNEVTLDSVVKARLGNTNQRGSEPQLMFFVYRQALDTQIGSSTFGKLRQWHAAMVPSTRVINEMQSMAAGITDRQYTGIPTPVTQTPWNAAFDQSTWGATQGEYVEFDFDYKPQINVGLGNGTLTQFALTRAPIDAGHTHVWVDGTLATVSSVNTSATNPSVTLSAAPGNNKLVFALVEHSQAQ